MKVKIFSVQDFDLPYLESHLIGHELSYSSTVLSADTVSEAYGYEAICLFSGDKVDASIAEQLAQNGVKYITTRSVGFDHIDIQAANQAGLAVANVPAYSPYSVSEFAVTLLLSLIRNIKQTNQNFEAQDFRLDGLVGFDIYKKTAGIVGCGRIGSNIANIMKGFGCEVLISDPAHKEGQQDGHRVTSLAELIAESDIIFLSCPLSEVTYHLIGTKELEQMKKGAVIVNTARGAVIDTGSLINKLNEGHIGGIAMDVYEYEKGLYFYDHRDKEIEDRYFSALQKFKNVLMTPHMGFLTKEALIGRAETTQLNLTQWANTGSCENEIIPKTT